MSKATEKSVERDLQVADIESRVGAMESLLAAQESRLAALEAHAGIRHKTTGVPSSAGGGPRIPADSRVYFKDANGGPVAGVVTSLPPDDGKYLVELPDGEQVWVHESELRGSLNANASIVQEREAIANAEPGDVVPVANPEVHPST